MENTSSYFEQAQLSMAAYSLNLQRGMSGSSDVNYVTLLRGNMSEVQAKAFADTYRVVGQYNDPTGFSGTVFERTDGEIFFAIRGSQNIFTEEGNLDVATDLLEIGREGVAVNQGLSMFNWLQRLYGAPGSSVQQFRYENGTIGTFTDTATGELNGKAGQITVSGHSLGGHLAMMLGRMAPDIFQNVYTYNAPGFDSGIWADIFGPPDPPAVTSEGFFSLLQNVAADLVTGNLGNTWNSSSVSNIDVEGDIVSDVGFRSGDQKTIFSETATKVIGKAKPAHDVKELTDALAVYNLLSEFNPNAGLDDITPVLKAASNEADKSLESVLNVFVDLFGVGGKVATGDRDALYQRIDDISEYRLENVSQAQWVSLAGFIPGYSRVGCTGAIGLYLRPRKAKPICSRKCRQFLRRPGAQQVQ